MASTKQGSPISFRPGLLAKRRLGQKANLQAQLDLEQYYALLDDALRGITFTEPEATLICEALSGMDLLDDLAHRHLWAEVYDACQMDHLDTKWGVTAAPLVQRLRDLTPLQRLAVLHAVRRFFGRPEEDTAPVLRDVGLVR